MSEVFQKTLAGNRRKVADKRVQWREVVEKKAYRGGMWKMMEKEPYLRGMCEYFLQERNRAKKFRELADEEKQAGIKRSVAAGIASQRILGASEMLP